jgi:formamidopyrimidine-DNA glycosylase
MPDLVRQTDRLDTIRVPSLRSNTRTSRTRPTGAPERSIICAVVRNRLPSLATQCGSMRWARYSNAAQTATVPRNHSSALTAGQCYLARRRAPHSWVVPEVLEVELTRRAANGLIGRTLVAIERTDPLVVDEGVDVAVPGSQIVGVDRRGKLLLFGTDGPVVGFHFGMTGRLLVDDEAAIDRLAYSGVSRQAVWDRWAVRLDDGRLVRLHDPRRLGRVRLDPDVSRLGPDALTLRRPELATALAGRRAPLKAVLLDQSAVAGLGNLLVDEILWWASLDPRQPAGLLPPDGVDGLQRTIRRRLPIMLRRGGSHTGTLSPALRSSGGHCPRDGAALARITVGGRTTVWCPSHQH